MSKKKKKHNKPKAISSILVETLTGEEALAVEQVTTGDILKNMPGYNVYLRIIQALLAICVISMAVSMLVRINLPDWQVVSLFFNALGWISVISGLIVWLFRVRNMRKLASAQAVSYNTKLNAPKAEERPRPEAKAERKRAKKDLPLGERLQNWLSGDPNKEEIPDVAEYLRYRAVWRACLIAAGLLIVIAQALSSYYQITGPGPLVVQLVSLLPILAAIYIYRNHLRPLKAMWLKHKDDKR